MNPSIHHIDLPTPHIATAAGKVIFIGAGPGDPELLTIKALRWLQRAEIVIADRLVSPEILTGYTTPAATIIPVGKQSHQSGSTAQETINELLLRHATAGRLVVRLKGGDISIFSNILDELQTLTAHGIQFELVPGITAALGAAAYAGIPLTARGHSAAVRILTSYRHDLRDDGYWRELAHTEDTLVFYMSSDPVDGLVTRLLELGIPADRWIALVEQATTPRQRVISWPIREYLANAAGARYASPTLIIIGRVASLHSSFRWLADGRIGDLYFPPIKDHKKIAVC